MTAETRTGRCRWLDKKVKFKFERCWRFPAPVFFLVSTPDDAELKLLQTTKHDVSGCYNFFKNGKIGPRGNMKIDKYHDELAFVNDLLVHVDKNDPNVVGKVLPRCAWPRVLQYFHAGPTVQHLGAAKVLDRMKDAVWWPSMDADVKRLCASCPLCVNKHVAVPPHIRPLLPLVTNYPNHIVAFDLFGPFLPTRAGNVYVEVATDLFTKYVQLRASKSAKAEDSVLTLRA